MDLGRSSDYLVGLELSLSLSCRPRVKPILRLAVVIVSSVVRPLAFSSLSILVAAAPRPMKTAKIGSAVLTSTISWAFNGKNEAERISW